MKINGLSGRVQDLLRFDAEESGSNRSESSARPSFARIRTLPCVRMWADCRFADVLPSSLRPESRRIAPPGRARLPARPRAGRSSRKSSTGRFLIAYHPPRAGASDRHRPELLPEGLHHEACRTSVAAPTRRSGAALFQYLLINDRFGPAKRSLGATPHGAAQPPASRLVMHLLHPVDRRVDPLHPRFQLK
jgi:hypothetical protein